MDPETMQAGYLTSLALGVGLSMDAFAVATAASVSLQPVSRRQVFRLAFHFGLFQAMMPVLGWLSGRAAHEIVADWDHWVAFGLLAFIGGKAIMDALIGADEASERSDPTRGLSLVIFSVATSIDAFAVGLSLAMAGTSIWQPALVIGVVTATLTTVGMLIGSKLGGWFGRGAEITGGVVLILIGVRILVEHLG